MRKGLIEGNPFDDVKGGSQRSQARLRFIDLAPIEKVLEAAPNRERRLIIATARFGGLCTPSETLALHWNHIDWEQESMTVPSPKTVKKGKPYRVVTILPELRPYQEGAFDAASAGAVHVVRRTRDPGVNWRTQYLTTILRAGVEPWPRLFHNLRASRQTELSETFPAHVVADWLCNTLDVAQARPSTWRPTMSPSGEPSSVGGGATGRAARSGRASH